MAAHFVVNVDVMELATLLGLYRACQNHFNLIMIHFFLVLCENQDLFECASKVEHHQWNPGDH